MRRAAAFVGLALLAVPSGASATFPGRNGELTVDMGALFRLGTSGGAPRMFGDGADPAWAANGRTLLFATWHPNENLVGRTAIAAWRDPPGGTPFFVTDPSTARREAQPSPAPNGSRFAFAAGERVYVAAMPDAQGNYPAPKLISSDGECPAWSPDGRSIAFWRETATGWFEIRRVTPTGRPLRRIFRDRLTLGCPDWSPNGRLVAFASTENLDAQRILVVTTAGKVRYRLNAQTFHEEPGSENPPDPGAVSVAFSPDARQLVYSADQWGTHVFNLRTRTRRQLYRTGGPIDWRPLPRR